MSKQETKSEVKKIKMVGSPLSAVEEIYVDGISGMMGRGGIIKLDCYRVEGVEKESDAEVRRISHRLVLPASSLSELIQVVQGVIKSANKAKE